MIDVANGGASIDAGVSVDRKDLLQSGIELALVRLVMKLEKPQKVLGY